MAATHQKSEAILRGARMLRTALGSAIATFLEDPAIVEVMLNPDGRLWVDRLSEGLSDTGERLSPSDGERIIRLVAHHVGAEVHPGAPRVSAELPETGERFEGLLPPVVSAPAFAIRKPAVAVFTLDDYVRAGIMSATQAEALLGVGDGLLGFFQVFAGLVEKGGDAADAVLDALHEPEPGVQERLLRQRESRAGHLGHGDGHIEGGEPGAGLDVDVEA